MNYLQKAQKSLEEAIYLLRHKDPQSTMVERYFLLYEAWDQVDGLSQALQMGKGLYYMLSHASVPVKEYDLLLGRYDDHVPSEEEQKKLDALWVRDPLRCHITHNNGGHRMLAWDCLLENGIPGYLSQADRRLQQAKAAGEDQNTLDFLEGMVWIYQGILVYIRHYSESAEKAGLTACAKVCERLTKGKPQTFTEALQLILFVYTIYLAYAGRIIACLSLGRLDDLLLPYYEKDLQTGILTEEEAGAYIDDFSAKMSLHLGRGEHQMASLNDDYVHTGWLRNPVYDSPGYIILGGYSNTRNHKQNPLTLLFAKHIHPQLKNPVYVCRYTSDCYDALWDILCEKVQQNASLLLYNDETMIPAQEYIGVERKDAVNYSVHPCNWVDIAGDFLEVGTCGEPLPVLLDRVLRAGQGYETMDQIYDAAKEAYAALLKPAFAKYRQTYLAEKPVSKGTLLFDDCFAAGVIPAARSLYDGGAKYPALYVLLRNIGTATDMLCAVDTLVFRKKVCTLSQLVKAASEDFVNDGDLLLACRQAPKYGTDNDLADGHACRLMNALLDVIDREATNEAGIRDVYTLNVTINDSNHLPVGNQMDATVDGRRKGKPLSENLSPTVGCGGSVTSVLNSVAKLPFERLHSGVLNIRLRKDTVAGAEGIIRIKALIQSYFEQGGMQVQVSIADTEDLKRAQQTPDDYRDLLVRITGYSAIFVDMSKGAQDEFIRREQLQ